MREALKRILERELQHATFEGQFYEDPYGGGVLAHKQKHIDRIVKEFIASVEITEIREDIRKRERDQTLKWVSNYWNTLKQHGMTERTLITKFNKFINSTSTEE